MSAMSGLLRGIARTAAVAGTATAVSNRVSRRQAGRWAAQDREQEPSPGSDPAAAQDVSTQLAQLRELDELRGRGVLSAEEFEAQKARILG
jgi:hypothetical protein